MKRFLLPSLLIAPLLPTAVAQYVVATLFALLVITSFKVRLLFFNVQWKALEAILFLPAVFTALNINNSLILRLFPIAFLVSLYPYKTFAIDPPLLRRSAQLGIIFCFTTQVLLAINNPFLLDIREQFYPIEINLWSYVDTFNFFQGFGEFRAAGLWYNPNVLAGNIFILYLALYSSFLFSAGNYKANNIVSFLKHDWILSLIVLYSLSLTGTRAYVFALPFFWILMLLPEILYLLQKRVKYIVIVIVTISIVAFAGTWNKIVLGFGDSSQGSITIKNRILVNYVNSVPDLNLLFGSGSNTHFDAEFGYWIGFGGIVALAGVLLFYLKLIIDGKLFYVLPPVATLIIVGFANTQLYNLMSASLLVPVIIFLSRTANNFRQNL